MTITKPGIVDGMTDAEYHGDPVEYGSISSSGARTLLKSPALYQWERTHRVEKTTYDVGHAVHAAVLGVGADVVLLDFETYRTKAAQEAKADVYADGKTPMLTKDYAPVVAMSEAVLAYPPARALLEKPGKSEQSLFAPDPETGVWLRARIDRLPDQDNGQPIAIDLKTSVSANPNEFAKSAAEYGYDIQGEWYKHALRLTRGDDADFLFIVVEKTAPYLVSVIELDAEFAAIGRARMRRSIDTFKTCRDADEWPGYEPIVHLVDPPRWLAYQEDMVLS